jgi:hypothetical protein
MVNLADRFEMSATRWARAVEAVERAYPIPKGSLDEEAATGFRLEREPDAVAHAGLRLLAGQALTHLFLQIRDLQESCESPIELPMALALATAARHEGISVTFVFRSGESGDWLSEEWSGQSRWPDLALRIEPQAQLGEHRVDFSLTLDGSFRAPDGRVLRTSQRMVIECDGHDFHERTREQARRDRERDRRLQSFGFLVYRYTGQEIWEDVFTCAAQAIESITEPVMRGLTAPPTPPGG